MDFWLLGHASSPTACNFGPATASSENQNEKPSLLASAGYRLPCATWRMTTRVMPMPGLQSDLKVVWQLISKVHAKQLVVRYLQASKSLRPLSPEKKKPARSVMHRMEIWSQGFGVLLKLLFQAPSVSRFKVLKRDGLHPGYASLKNLENQTKDKEFPLHQLALPPLCATMIQGYNSS